MKTSVSSVSNLEAKLAARRLDARLKVATKGELINAVHTMSRAIVEMTSAVHDEDTSIYLTAEIACGLIEKSNGKASPVAAGIANCGHISSIVNVFGKASENSGKPCGGGYVSETDRRRVKIMKTMKIQSEVNHV